MTPQQFRKVALSLPQIVEGAHMGHADFRLGGRIVATLGAPNDQWGMVKLTPEQQQTVCMEHAETFQPCNRAWGRQGYTAVRLSAAKTSVVRAALQLALENAGSAGRVQ